MHSFAALDENFEPLHDMQTWADSRSAAIVREMKKDEALCRSFYERTGCPIHACYPLAKIIWLRQNQPELFRQMRFAGSLKDYLYYHLTGEWLVDKSTASTTGMYNEHTLAWDDEIIAYAGITKDQLPPVVSTTYSHGLSEKAAKTLRLPEAFLSSSAPRTASWSTSHRCRRTGTDQRYHRYQRGSSHVDPST